MNKDRKKIEDLKASDETVKHRDFLKTCGELELFVMIDQLGYIIWRTEHDLADGRITYPEWDIKDKFFLQAEIELSVAESCRFGVRPFDVGTTIPTDDYCKWYKWWKNYVEGMPKEQWDEICNVSKDNGADLSSFRPEGDWRTPQETEKI